MSRDGWSTWLEALSSEREPHGIDALRRACEVAAAAHKGQNRASGEPYITHPLAVADILQSLGLDVDTLVAAILRDVVEDTPITLNDLTTQFGSQVTGLVDGREPGSPDSVSAVAAGAPSEFSLARKSTREESQPLIGAAQDRNDDTARTASEPPVFFVPSAAVQCY